jgi:hypothetical protein
MTKKVNHIHNKPWTTHYIRHNFLHNSSQNHEGVIDDVTKAAGKDAKVVEPKALIEIKDIDEWSTKKEIKD